MSKTNPQRKISRLQLKKLKEAAEYNDKVRVDYRRATITITKRNTLKEKYTELEEQHATNLVERNSFLLEKERVETELYFCNRNRRVKESVNED